MYNSFFYYYSFLHTFNKFNKINFSSTTTVNGLLVQKVREMFFFAGETYNGTFPEITHYRFCLRQKIISHIFGIRGTVHLYFHVAIYTIYLYMQKIFYIPVYYIYIHIYGRAGDYFSNMPAKLKICEPYMKVWPVIFINRPWLIIFLIHPYTSKPPGNQVHLEIPYASVKCVM